MLVSFLFVMFFLNYKQKFSLLLGKAAFLNKILTTKM